MPGKSWILWCLSLVLIGLPILAVGQSQKTKGQGAKGSATVLFAVSKVEGADPSLEPIVILGGGKYSEPPVDGDQPTPPPARKFITTYFQPGQKYRLLFGGGEIGTATIKNYVSPACFSMEATVTLQTSVRLGGEVKALATNAASLGKGKNSRRTPTPDERAAMLDLVKKTYQQKGIPASFFPKIEVVNLTALDLDGDGKAELIGSFSLEKKKGSYLQDNLFLLAESHNGSYRIGLVWYHRNLAEDGIQQQKLVDQIDLDQDGMAEVVTMTTYYESNNYQIYKRQKGKWTVIYQGGGGGC